MYIWEKLTASKMRSMFLEGRVVLASRTVFVVPAVLFV
jgi:hypothetical protein